MGLTYNGSTVGSTLANPPVELEGPLGGAFQYATTGVSSSNARCKIWLYASTNDITDLKALNAVNDGLALGIKPGDILFQVKATDGSTTPVLQAGVFAWPATAATTGICLSSNVFSSTQA